MREFTLIALLLTLLHKQLTLALTTEISDQLLNEGLAREFVNRVQNMRKEADFLVTDRINIAVKASERMTSAIKSQADYIKNETLCFNIEHGHTSGDFQKELKIDDYRISVGLSIIK